MKNIQDFKEFLNELKSDTLKSAYWKSDSRKEHGRAKEFQKHWAKTLNSEGRGDFKFTNDPDIYVFAGMDLDGMAIDTYMDSNKESISFDLSFQNLTKQSDTKNWNSVFDKWYLYVDFDDKSVNVEINDVITDTLKSASKQSMGTWNPKFGLDHIGKAKKLKRLIIQDIENWNNPEFDKKEELIELLNTKLNIHKFLA